MLYLPMSVSPEQSVFDAMSAYVANRQRIWRDVLGVDNQRDLYLVGDRALVVVTGLFDGKLSLFDYSRDYYGRVRTPIYYRSVDDMAAVLQAGIEAARAEIALLKASSS